MVSQIDERLLLGGISGKDTDFISPNKIVDHLPNMIPERDLPLYQQRVLSLPRNGRIRNVIMATPLLASLNGNESGVMQAMEQNNVAFDTVEPGIDDPQGMLLQMEEKLERVPSDPDDTIYIDTKVQNCIAPLALGMGAIQVNDPHGLEGLIGKLTEDHHYVPFSIDEFINDHARAGGVTIVGITGSTGSGKTTLAQEITTRSADYNLHTAILSIDDFHLRSRKEKAAWFKDAPTKEERARRENYDSWFDFGRAREALTTLREGNPIHLTNVYNYATGELDAEKVIQPVGDSIIILEGVALQHLADHLDALYVVISHPTDRFTHLLARDPHRPLSALNERMLMTQKSDFQSHTLRADKADGVIVNHYSGSRHTSPVYPII